MKKKLLVVDDDEMQLVLMKRQLKKSGYEVLALNDSSLFMESVESFKPDAAIVDLLMPKVDGYSLIKKIRGSKKFRAIKIIVVSAKTFEFDQKRAYELGADAFLKKPVEYKELKNNIEKVLKDEIKITFWGARGTIIRPGKDYLKYGGNTSSVSVELTRDRLFVFDAGSGIIEFGKYISSKKRNYKINLLISHPHWDHIHGFPFFSPIYDRGNELAIYGSSHGDISLREVISGQMESIYFPITIKEFASRVYFQEISEGDYEVDGIKLSALLLNHPGNALGYRMTTPNGKKIAYITDNELFPKSTNIEYKHFRKKMVNFLRNVDVLIHDSTYFDDEYESRIGWGHSPITELLKLSADAKAKHLYLFHHDPEHNDKKVSEKEKIAKDYLKKHKLKLQCSAAIEGHSFCL